MFNTNIHCLATVSHCKQFWALLGTSKYIGVLWCTLMYFDVHWGTSRYQMLVVPVANFTSILMPVVVLLANILMPDPREPNPPILSLPSSSWSLEVRRWAPNQALSCARKFIYLRSRLTWYPWNWNSISKFPLCFYAKIFLGKRRICPFPKKW